jgi:hypothetical protein
MSSRTLGLFFDLSEASNSPSWYFWWCDNPSSKQTQENLDPTAEQPSEKPQLDRHDLQQMTLAGPVTRTCRTRRRTENTRK